MRSAKAFALHPILRAFARHPIPCAMRSAKAVALHPISDGWRDFVAERSVSATNVACRWCSRRSASSARRPRTGFRDRACGRSCRRRSSRDRSPCGSRHRGGPVVAFAGVHDAPVAGLGELFEHAETCALVAAWRAMRRRRRADARSSASDRRSDSSDGSSVSRLSADGWSQVRAQAHGAALDRATPVVHQLVAEQQLAVRRSQPRILPAELPTRACRGGRTAGPAAQRKNSREIRLCVMFWPGNV